ncbi:MAG TPA: HEAT repeat domain-containing protein [Acidimicrobiia bacterium]|nr:HEAT repeat domain-containing protein [Acidimicrobiia bacterium]
MLGPAVSCASHHAHEDPYLKRAFLTLSSPISHSANALAANLREEALRGDPRYDIDEADIHRFGQAGFAGIAQLLRDEDPRVRSAGAFYLSRWNRSDSVPFLIGLLRDNEPWPDALGFYTLSPARTAGHLLGSMYACSNSDRDRVPVDERSHPDVGLARQRWYAHHFPYCFIEGSAQLPIYYWYPMAAYFEVPAAEIQAFRSSHPESFRCVPFVTIGASKNVYTSNEAIPVSLSFSNYGTDLMWLRYDQTEVSVHHFELVSDDGKPVPMRRHALKPLPPHTPLKQPLYGDCAFGLGGWVLDLADLFTIPGPGEYRFRYWYTATDDRDAEGCSVDFGLRVWDGRAYSEWFRFVVTP